MSQTGGQNINNFIDLFKKGEWFEAIGIMVDAIIYAVKDIADNVVELVKDIATAGIEFIQGDPQGASNVIKEALSVISRSSLARYRIKFNQIIPAMTGDSSAPWHVTIGNPKNPFFSSGDMIAEGCKITFGNTLGFNDYPTRIDYEFTIRSARNLGIQEIFDKFNIGAGRQYQRDNVTFKVDWNQGRIKNEIVEENNGSISSGVGATVLTEEEQALQNDSGFLFTGPFVTENEDDSGFSGIPGIDPETGLQVSVNPNVYSSGEAPNGGLSNTAGGITGVQTEAEQALSNAQGGLSGLFGGN
jgi:hypothetical protein